MEKNLSANTPEQYKVIYRGGTGEIVEKKSRFIATVRPIQTEDEAFSFIEETRKRYWDATHNCHAFVLGVRNEIARCSDDGEPSGTAGKPMLDVLLGEGIHNAAVVVTRYFGGTLLGTGGLVRAYSGAVQAGLAQSEIIEKRLSHKLRIKTDYTGIGKIQYIAGTMQLLILDSEYSDVVVVTVLTCLQNKDSFIKKVTEATSGRAVIDDLGLCYSACCDKETLIFEL